MRSYQIIYREIKKQFPHMAEEEIKLLIKLIFEKCIPACSIECTNLTEKAIFTGLASFSPAIEKILLEMTDKIDGQEG